MFPSRSLTNPMNKLVVRQYAAENTRTILSSRKVSRETHGYIQRCSELKRLSAHYAAQKRNMNEILH